MRLTERKKLLVYKILLFVFAFAVAFMPSTVSRNREVNNRVIVEMLGIDGGDGVEVTAQYVMPSEGDSASKDTVSVKAKTLPQAVESLSTALGRRAELGHCSVVVVGSDAPTEHIGTLMTATDITADVYVCAAESSAKELIGKLVGFIGKTGATDADIIAYGAQKSHIATTTALNFLSDLGSYSKTAYMPLVQVIESEEKGGSSGGSGGSSSGSGGGESSGGGSGGGGGGGESKSSESVTGMKIEKLALYSADGRAGVIDMEGARGVAYVSAPIEEGVLTADVEYGGEVIKDVCARLMNKSARVMLSKDNATATVKLKLKIEPMGDKFNIIDAKNDAAAEEAVKAGFKKSVEKELKAGFYDARALGCDPMFVMRKLYRRDPAAAKLRALDDMEVNFDVEIVLK